MGLRQGDPVDCPCGSRLVVLFREAIYRRALMGERIPCGERFHYRCDRCRRELDVRWLERNLSLAKAQRTQSNPGPA